MIRNKLAALMADRGLKITRVAKETGISRNTITSIAQNDSEMIRLETINTLCKYLSITPCEFFEFEPVDFSFSAFVNEIQCVFTDSNKNAIRCSSIKLDIYMDIKEAKRELNFEFYGELIGSFELELSPIGYAKVPLYVEFADNDERELFENETYKKISATFHGDIYNSLKTAIHDEISEKIFERFAKEFDYKTPFLSGYELFKRTLEIDVVSQTFSPF